MSQIGSVGNGGGGGGGGVPTEWVEITMDDQPLQMGKGYWHDGGDSLYVVSLPATATAFTDRIWFQTGWNAQGDIYVLCNPGQRFVQGNNTATSTLQITTGATSPTYVEIICVETDTVFVITTTCIDAGGSPLLNFVS